MRDELRVKGVERAVAVEHLACPRVDRVAVSARGGHGRACRETGGGRAPDAGHLPSTPTCKPLSSDPVQFMRTQT